MSSTLATALWVATKWPGARVFPTDGKVPALRELGSVPWNEAATTDPDVIAGWFTGTHWGVGVTGILAIDCDTDNGWTATHEFGVEVLEGVRWFGNPDRRTFAFRQPDEPFGDGRWPGGEVKGSGYVVLPPSWHYAPDTCEVCVEGERTHHYAWDSQWESLPPLPASVESALDGLVRRQHAGPVVEATDEQVEAWSTAGAPCRAVSAALVEWTDGMLADHPARHDLMAHAQMRLLRLGEQGHAGVAAALDTVWSGFLHSVEKDKARHRQAPDEWARAAKGAAARIVSEGLTDPLDMGCCGASDEDAIFGATPLLSDLRQYARANDAMPFAVLGSALALAVAETQHQWHLPGQGSLNLFVALSGPPGVGKSRSWRAAKNFLRLAPDDEGIALHTGHGTGEGLMQSFMTKNEKGKDPAYIMREDPNVIVYVDEIGQMAATNGRGGAIGDSVLRSMWSGSMVSTLNADTNRRRHLPDNGYTLAIVAGIQPELGNHLFGRDAAASGMAQRWLTLPVLDTTLDPDLTYAMPEVRVWSRPNLRERFGEAVIGFPADVLAEVEHESRLVRSGRLVRDPLDEHRTFLRMKVAAALALLHGSIDVDNTLWGVAGALLDVSTATRSEVLAAMSRDRRARKRAEGADAAEADEGRDEARIARGAVAVCREVAKHAGQHDGEGCTRKCLTRALRRYRDVVDECIAAAVAGGKVQVMEGVPPRYGVDR